MKVFGWTMAFLLSMVFGSILNGYALSVLWGWFVVKTFGLPALSIPTAIGLAMIVSYLTIHLDGKQDERSAGDRLLTGILWSIIKPAFSLATGWVVVQFV